MNGRMDKLNRSHSFEESISYILDSFYCWQRPQCQLIPILRVYNIGEPQEFKFAANASIFQFQWAFEQKTLCGSYLENNIFPFRRVFLSKLDLGWHSSRNIKYHMRGYENKKGSHALVLGLNLHSNQFYWRWVTFSDLCGIDDTHICTIYWFISWFFILFWRDNCSSEAFWINFDFSINIFDFVTLKNYCSLFYPKNFFIDILGWEINHLIDE
jgi:hypothetical protein